MHNTCEDSLLATPLILDLVILCELCERITVRYVNLKHSMLSCGRKRSLWVFFSAAYSFFLNLNNFFFVWYEMQLKCDPGSDAAYERFHSVLSLLSYLMKAPLVPTGTPVVNALGAQRQVSDDNLCTITSSKCF